jgi:nicotinate-nucleotide adenylyltransferase
MGLSGIAVAPVPTAVPAEVRSWTRGAWGVLGGTFDPPHFGHLAIAEHVRAVLDLVGVLFVPAGVPPHKQGQPISPVADRVAMVEGAIAGNPAFRLSRVEVDRPGPSYTADTLALLHAEPLVGAGGAAPAGDARRYVLILSTEALLGLPGWHDPQRILRQCLVAVVPRPGYRAPGRAWFSEHFPGQEARVIFVEGPELGHSASLIRRYASEGLPIRYLVPPAVEAYVVEHGLYDGWPRPAVAS